MADRFIPSDVKRALRQEAFFGCAACGSPILEYHHIVPWSEEQHNDPVHMIALCPTHHRSLGKMYRKKCYDLKNAPYNRQAGLIKGGLGTDAIIDRFVAGTNTYIDTPVILSYFGRPLISYRVEDGEFLLSVYLPDDDLWPSLKIIDNDMQLNKNGIWDFEFRTNYLKLKRDDGTFFEIDIRRNEAFAAGDLNFSGLRVKFDNKDTQLGGATIRNGTFSSCGGGIAIGADDVKVDWPSYAMLKPEAYFRKVFRGR